MTKLDRAGDNHQPGGSTRTVAIFGGYGATEGEDAYTYALKIGQGLAKAGIEVLNGGYDGTMRASSQGAKEAGGVTVGVTCAADISSARGPMQPNPFIDLELPAPDILSRINAMMRLSGGYVFLDGGTGTLSELGIVWEFVAKGFMPPRPIVLAGHTWDDLYGRMGDYRAGCTKHVYRADTPEGVVGVLDEHTVRGTRARYSSRFDTGVHDLTATVDQLKQVMQRFIEQRAWQPFHDPKNLSASIAIEAAELMEHFQWVRSEDLDALKGDAGKMAEIREEIADILAYTLSFASTMDIDLASALADKMVKNAVKYPVDAYKGRFEIKAE